MPGLKWWRQHHVVSNRHGGDIVRVGGALVKDALEVVRKCAQLSNMLHVGKILVPDRVRFLLTSEVGKLSTMQIN